MITVTVTDPDGKELISFVANAERTLLEQTEEMTSELLAKKDLSDEEKQSQLDFELPFSCRAGACMTCCVIVKEGIEFLDETLGGEKFIDTDDDQFLTCIGGVKKEPAEDDQEHKVVLEMMDYM